MRARAAVDNFCCATCPGVVIVSPGSSLRKLPRDGLLQSLHFTNEIWFGVNLHCDRAKPQVQVRPGPMVSATSSLGFGTAETSHHPRLRISFARPGPGTKATNSPGHVDPGWFGFLRPNPSAHPPPGGLGQVTGKELGLICCQAHYSILAFQVGLHTRKP